MRNILIIGLIVVAMGYMFSLLFDRYEAAVEQQNTQKELQQK
ncbi:hypothetical protein GCM10012288_13900 [Malaciobacter pacificus]|jgi:uncharacterized membrane protein YraQ (UPF0718 family)|nr:hypothetical protein [Malaciobacter pacificus]GGD41046.1 hypothetical protein GCM10012288_13900 [Malaciobacter pacificus]